MKRVLGGYLFGNFRVKDKHVISIFDVGFKQWKIYLVRFCILKCLKWQVTSSVWNHFFYDSKKFTFAVTTSSSKNAWWFWQNFKLSDKGCQKLQIKVNFNFFLEIVSIFVFWEKFQRWITYVWKLAKNRNVDIPL